MGVDYYETLGLTRNASPDNIKDAFRKLSLHYHPDRNQGNKASVDSFLKVCEAYEVLSDAKAKSVFDKYGEGGLKIGVPDGKGGLVGGFYSWADYRADRVFASFFGTNNPFQALGDLTSTFEKLAARPPLEPGQSKVLEVECSLEEIFRGCTKVVKHERQVESLDGIPENQVIPLTMVVKPGAKAGTKFVFPKAGDQIGTKEQAPIVYVLKDKPHPVFRRFGLDLIHEATIPLFKALNGAYVDMATLDGRKLRCHMPEIIRPGVTKVIQGEGMPNVGSENGPPRGNLCVVFNLVFPTFLSEVQKQLLKSAFYYPARPTAKQQAAVKVYLGAFTNDTHGWSTGFAHVETAHEA